MGLNLEIIPELLAISRLAPDADLPQWATKGSFHSVTQTREELSIVCEEGFVPSEIQAERGWRGFKIQGPLDFALTGILLRIAKPLAKAGIGLFAISTFDTDYVLVKEEKFSMARQALANDGHSIGMGQT